jgi:exonuclease III
MNFGRQKTRQQNLRTKYLNGKKDVKLHEELKLLTINVNSIHGSGKYDLAAMNIYESDPDVAILTETRLGDQSNTFKVSGYQIVTQIDRRQGAGGLMIMAKNGVKIHSATSESIIDKIQVAKCKFKDLTIFGVYRSPTVDTESRTTKEHHASLINYLNKHINKLGKSRYIITGDFNLKEMAKHDFNPPGMKIADDEDVNNITPDHMWSDFYNKNGLEQYVKDPTYYSTIGGSSILDLVLAPRGTEITALVVDPERFGPEFDHNSVEFSVEMNFSTYETLKKIRKPNKESWKKVREDLMNSQLNEDVHKIAQTPKIPNQDDYPFHPTQ